MGDFASMLLPNPQETEAKRQAAALATQRNYQIQETLQQQAAQERQKRDELRRAQATQRARFAGAGINPAVGSASSLLSGLANQVDQAIADNRSLTNLRIDDINANTAAQTDSLFAPIRVAQQQEQQKQLTNGINTAVSLFI